MNRLFSWFQHKDNSSSAIAQRKHEIKSYIVNRQTKEFLRCLQQDNYDICMDAFFQVLSTKYDEQYMSDLFEIIIKKSRFKSKPLSTIITDRLSEAVSGEDFELCERILNLPLPSVQIPVPTMNLVDLIHRYPNKDRLAKWLLMLSEKNLRYDSKYLSWLLMIILEHFEIGDEILIDNLLTMTNNKIVLCESHGNFNVTPLMLFFHMYTDSKCQAIIDDFLLRLKQEKLLDECDKWNRSYLAHLLGGRCQHTSLNTQVETAQCEDLNTTVRYFGRCPHAISILSRFSMLYTLGNRLDTPVKTILQSQYCLALRMSLLHFVMKNDNSITIEFHELVNYFTEDSVKSYLDYFKFLTGNYNLNLNSSLTSVLIHRNYNPSMDTVIEFLLQQGARIEHIDNFDEIIIQILVNSRLMVPFMLLDYGIYANVTYENWSRHPVARVNFYVCRAIQYGYPITIRSQFQLFKALVPEHTKQIIEKLINLTNPTTLHKLCIENLRKSLKHLGDKVIDKLDNYVPKRVKKSIQRLEYDEYRNYLK